MERAGPGMRPGIGRQGPAAAHGVQAEHVLKTVSSEAVHGKCVMCGGQVVTRESAMGWQEQLLGAVVVWAVDAVVDKCMETIAPWE